MTTSPHSEQDRLARGLAALREGRYFDAHEEWEKVWQRASGAERRCLQGLIQLAAAGVHLRKGRTGPAARLLDLAIAKLQDTPEDFLGIPAGALLTRARTLRSGLAAGTIPAESVSLFSPPLPRRTA
ncbi:MAG: DUF309 domain-containing protein [Holophagales bacterium]|nr:DUF309 domain-containing protein [Holophagales bacterium]